jgi:hypothetical protein
MRRPVQKCHAAVLLLALGTVIGITAGRAFAEPAETAPRLQLARGEDGKVELAFSPVAGTKTYTIRVIHDDGRTELIENAEAVNYAVHGLPNDRVCRFAVCAVADGRKGPWSNELSATPTASPGWTTLRQAFQSNHPTRNANPFVSIDGRETEAELRAMVRAVYDAGFEGVTLLPINWADYLGPGHWDRLRIIIDQARRLGLVVWHEDDQTYPSGFAAGKVVAAHPEFGRTTLVEALQQELTGPQGQFSLDVRPLLKGRDFLVAVSAYPTDASAEPLDLTDRVVDGKLACQIPAGKWRLFVVKAVWCGPVPVADMATPMPLVDFLNPRATDAYIEAIYQATFDRFRSDFGRTFQGFFSDEAPVDFTQFTPDFLERFQKSKGYSIRKWLPSITRDLSKNDRKVRGDYRDFIREQNAVVFFGRAEKWCREHGVQFIGHVIEDHQQDMRRLEMLDIPGCDNVFGQWYDPDPDVYWRQLRMTSSVAHYNGVRNDLALIEHFAATGSRTGLSEMKRMMDWSTVMGINQIVPCGMSTQSPPIWEVCPDFWLHGKNPQFPYFHEYQAAADRMTMLMRGGRHVAPAIVLDTTESQWVKDGVDLRWQHSARDDLWKACAAMSQAHVDFDLIPYNVFADAKRTTFEKGVLRIGKEDYRAVVLPGVEFVPAAVVERLRDFRRSGGVVVALGRTPAKSCNGDEDARVTAAVAEAWGPSGASPGRSAVAKRDNLESTLVSLDVPDVRMSPSPKQLLYCHRRLHGKDIYFFANTGAEPLYAKVDLRGVHGVPTLWDAVSGTISLTSVYSNEAGHLRMRLDLGEYESTFVVVEPASTQDKDASMAFAMSPRTLTLPAAWQVSKGVDDHHRLFTTDVQLPADWPIDSPVWLELKGASQVVRVEVNGRTVGRRFCAPYCFEVGEALHVGNNRILVERVGRISLPNSVTPAAFNVIDAAAKAPCVQATLVTHLETILRREPGRTRFQ